MAILWQPTSVEARLERHYDATITAIATLWSKRHRHRGERDVVEQKGEILRRRREDAVETALHDKQHLLRNVSRRHWIFKGQFAILPDGWLVVARKVVGPQHAQALRAQTVLTRVAAGELHHRRSIVS